MNEHTPKWTPLHPTHRNPHTQTNERTIMDCTEYLGYN